MDILFLFVILALFLLPPFFAMRRQQKHQREVLAFQAALTPGKRVVTTAGIHGTVVNVRDTEVDLDIAQGTVVTFDRMAILRAPQTADAVNAAATNGAAGDNAVNGADTGTDPVAGPELTGDYRSGDYGSDADYGTGRGNGAGDGYESGYDHIHPDDRPREN